MVREVQRSFYSDCGGEGRGPVPVPAIDGTHLVELPLWRVQWSELPGRQTVLNVHVPHYTHMFQRVLAAAASSSADASGGGGRGPLFGHLYLPGGSASLDDARYRLGAADVATDAARYGTLMRVTGHTQLSDGRLAVVAQALGTIRVDDVSAHVPYSVASRAALVPDAELARCHLDGAVRLVTARVGNGGTAGGGGRGEEGRRLAWGAARAAAAAEAVHWEGFEFRPVRVEECLGGAGGGAAQEVSPLANYDAGGVPGDPFDAVAAMEAHLDAVMAEEEVEGSSSSSAGAAFSEPPPPVDHGDEVDRILTLERDVWTGVDLMIRLLRDLSPDPGGPIPVPTQLLGMLPVGVEWPESFALEDYVEGLAAEDGALVGTASRSPFVWASRVAPEYPALRRAQRLSFAIWVLLDSSLAGYGPASGTLQSVLELDSIYDRLKAAERGLLVVNQALKNTFNGA